MTRDHPDYLRHYREIIDERGASFEATGWRNRDFQIERFRVFTEMLDFEGLVVLDAGAGRADFARYLLDEGIAYRRFIAADAMPEMIEAIEARRLDRVEAALCDFAAEDQADAFTRFGPVDAVVFSGSLNTLPQSRAETILDRAWDVARRAVVFNFLSDRAPRERLTHPTHPAMRFDTTELVDRALTRTHLVRFRQDYLDGHDATIAMIKPPAAG